MARNLSLWLLALLVAHGRAVRIGMDAGGRDLGECKGKAKPFKTSDRILIVGAGAVISNVAQCEIHIQ